MSDFSLYKRIKDFGTILDDPSDIPDARFALPSTIHWMKALSIIIKAKELDFSTSLNFYKTKNIQRRNMTERVSNTVFEQLLFSLSQIASLQAISQANNKADISRMAIISWYYGIYSAASAMIAANDDSFPDNHSATAGVWDRNFPYNGLVMEPFSERVPDLLDSTVKTTISNLQLKGKSSLTTSPTNQFQAWGCIAEYLSGTSKWEQWNIKERVVKTKEFKALGVNNFLKKPARELRDQAYSKKSISFLHQAFRYRGKANYRDAIYLAYGKSIPNLLTNYVDDLKIVLTAFTVMSGAYCSLRIGSSLWKDFNEDLENKVALSISPKDIWS